MVSGSDTHGTPITVKAEEEDATPIAIVNCYHQGFIDTFQRIGLTFDLFTHTHTTNHQETVQELFCKLYESGYIYKDSSEQLFDNAGDRFLPDRYVEGTCPKCGFEEARGDQCDKCGATYDATDLLKPISKMNRSSDLEIRTTEHFYLDLAKLNEPCWIGLKTTRVTGVARSSTSPEAN